MNHEWALTKSRKFVQKGSVQLGPDYVPEYESIKQLLLDVAQERSADTVLRMVVERLAQRPHIAVARVWLIRPGDICTACPMRADCPDQRSCLHLVASAGRPRHQSADDWASIDGAFQRVPLATRKVGHIAATGEPVIVHDIDDDTDRWMVDRAWLDREGIRGFAGQPLMAKGEILGVLAVLSRIPYPKEATVWLRMIADHAAAAILNARAFEEIDRLRGHLELENAYLRAEVLEAQQFGDIVGQSHALRALLQQIELVAPTDANVLILGESGTGKELVAREIHRRSLRSQRPMIKVNCASIPKELFESEFFGHVRGSFTGAVKDRAGRFQLADGGTLFLDEVGEIPLDMQSKLLRVLQDGEYERVGEESTRRCDVRVVAATNRDLRREVDAGRFRQDLYFRLNVFPVQVAPLRERTEDIPLLAMHFLEQMARKLSRPVPRVTQATVLELQGYDWPGNVRELQHAIERAVIVSGTGPLRVLLPERVVPAAAVRTTEEPSILTDAELRRRERDNLMLALERAGWKVYGAGGAAEMLGLKPTTLASRIEKLGLRPPMPS